MRCDSYPPFPPTPSPQQVMSRWHVGSTDEAKFDGICVMRKVGGPPIDLFFFIYFSVLHETGEIQACIQGLFWHMSFCSFAEDQKQSEPVFLSFTSLLLLYRPFGWISCFRTSNNKNNYYGHKVTGMGRQGVGVSLMNPKNTLLLDVTLIQPNGPAIKLAKMR